jgi:hypothetical protein
MRNVSDLTDKAFESIHHLRVGDFIFPYRELPSAAIAAVENLTGIFDVATPAEREAITQRVHRPFAFVFERYAHSCAVESVRRNDPSLIKRGLVAPALENAKVDWLDTLPVAALLHNSAVRLKTDAGGLFASIGEIAQPPMRGILSSCGEPTESRTIESYHYKESGQGSSFTYIYVEPPSRIPSRTEWKIRPLFRKLWRRLPLWY